MKVDKDIIDRAVQAVKQVHEKAEVVVMFNQGSRELWIRLGEERTNENSGLVQNPPSLG